MGLSLQLIVFNSARETVEAIQSNIIDMIFVAIDPLRENIIRFSPSYLSIEGSYMTKFDSGIRTHSDVDKEGITIVVGKGSARTIYFYLVKLRILAFSAMPRLKMLYMPS